MTHLEIKVDLKPFMRLGINLENTRRALLHAGVTAQKTWVDYASGAPVKYSGGTFVIRRITGNYVRGIEAGLRMGVNGNPLGVAIEVNEQTVPYAKYIESGVRSHDMKTYLLYGTKVKTSKAGKRYLTIPFYDRANSAIGGGRTGNVTFRRCSETSTGWIHPGTPPRPATLAVKENMEDELKDIIRQGVLLDLQGRG